MILTRLKNKFEFLRIVLFLLINYAIAMPFFNIMLGFIGQSSSTFFYPVALIAFFPLLLIFVLRFAKQKSFGQKFIFSFLWVFSSAVLVEALMLLLNNAQFSDGMAILAGDWTLLVPVWLGLSLIELVLGFFLLHEQFNLPSKYLMILKVGFIYWTLSTAVLVSSTASFLLKASLPLVLASYFCIKGMKAIDKASISTVRRYLYLFVYISIWISLVGMVANLFVTPVHLSFLEVLGGGGAYIVFLLPLTIFIILGFQRK